MWTKVRQNNKAEMKVVWLPPASWQNSEERQGCNVSTCLLIHMVSHPKRWWF